MSVVPIILCAKEKADLAFAAHTALLAAEVANPALRDNPCWTLLRQEAFDQFASAYQRIG